MTSRRLKSTRHVIVGVAAAFVLSSCTGGPYVPPEDETTRANTLLQGLRGAYVDPDNPALTWAAGHSRDPQADRLEGALSDQPVGIRINKKPDLAESQVSRIAQAAAEERRIPFFVAEKLASSNCETQALKPPFESEYLSWITAVQAGLGDKPAVIVLEPNGLTGWGCLAADQQDSRLTLIRKTIRSLNKSPHLTILIGIASGEQEETLSLVPQLKDLGLEHVNGIALNVSKYVTTAKAKRVALSLRARLGLVNHGFQMVVDTGRSGAEISKGPCNPSDARVGQREFLTGDASRIKTIWLTVPGVSDGPCGDAPRTTRGEFDAGLAMQLLGDAETSMKTPQPAELRSEFERELSGNQTVKSVAISVPDPNDSTTWMLLVTVAQLPKSHELIGTFKGIVVQYVVGSGFRG